MINIPQAVYPALATVFASQGVHVVALPGVDLNVLVCISPQEKHSSASGDQRYPALHTAEKQENIPVGCAHTPVQTLPSLAVGNNLD